MAQVEDAIEKLGGGQELKRIAKQVTKDARKSPIPVFIAALAAFLALVSMANGDADKRASQAHLEATNQFAYFQAKNIRKTQSQVAADTLGAMGQAELATKWKKKADRYNVEKKKILKVALGEQAKRAVASKQGNYFDVAISALQIAIVLASASLILGGGMLLWLSVFLTFVAGFFTINGYGLYLEVLTNPIEIFHWLKLASGISFAQ